MPPTTTNENEHTLLDKIRQLPPQRLAEVEDFVDFLRTREVDQRVVRAAAKANVVIMAITSQVRKPLLPGDALVSEWQAARPAQAFFVQARIGDARKALRHPQARLAVSG